MPGSTTGALEHVFEHQGEYMVTATLTDVRVLAALRDGDAVTVEAI